MRSIARFVSTRVLAAFAACTTAPPATDAAVLADAATAADAAVATDAGAPADASPADVPGDLVTAPFALTSVAFTNGGTLPVVYTCDGAGHSPPLAWTGVPQGTTEFAVTMTTLARDGLKWNWVLFHVPGSVRSLAEQSAGVGTNGITSDGPALAYSPPCSQGPGPMMYTFTVYALSASPTLPAQARQVTGAVLEGAIAAITLGRASATVTYTR